MSEGTRGPVLIDLEAEVAESPADAAPVADLIPVGDGATMQQVAAIAARRPSRLARWFWGLLVTLLGFVLSVALWDFVAGLFTRTPVLGYAALELVVALLGALLIVAAREFAAFNRLQRIDRIQRMGAEALAAQDLAQARDAVAGLHKLYAGRSDTALGRRELDAREGEVLDADALLAVAEDRVLAPLDARAAREIEAAARQVATVTALVPLALADVIAALTANLRMIRRIAEIYGGRSGTLGSWRLTRTVFTHLVATGAVAVGDDLIGSIAGGGLLSKLSRRFGEGVINGALTARVGVAAMEVCRPLAFHTQDRPSVTGLCRRALTGLFGGTEA